MLQIIGWILCTALLLWGISLFGNVNYRVGGEPEEKKMSEAGNAAAVLAIFSALGFALLLYLQGQPLEDAYSYSGSSTSNMSEAELEQLAEDALRAAQGTAEAADASADAAGR